MFERVIHKLRCVVCGNGIPPAKGLHIRLYCSHACNQQASRNRCKDKQDAAKSSNRLSVSERKQFYLCQHCHTIFKPKGSGRITFCSRECSYAAKRELSKKRMSLRRIARNWRPKRERKRHRCHCFVCSKVFNGGKGAMYCSQVCRSKSYTKLWTTRNSVSRCGQCNTVINQDTFSQGYKRTCINCIASNKRDSERRRRARKRGADTRHVWWNEILKRDRFKCQRCGCKVKTRGDVCHDRYAHMDHITPLAKGGPHHPGNIQVLCRKCNLSKSDNTGDDQLCLCLETKSG